MKTYQVLLIDSDITFLNTLSAHLTEHGYQVHCAHTAHEGVSAAMKYSPEAIIFELSLPGSDGMGLCETFRSTPQLHSTTLIALSQVLDQNKARLAVDKGICATMVKPVEPDTLAFVLDELLRTKWDQLEAPSDAAQQIVTPSTQMSDTSRGAVEKMVNEFISIAAHELRTPLAIIKNSLDITQEGKATAQEQTYVMDVAQRNLQRMSRIISQISDIYSLEMNAQNIAKRKILFYRAIAPTLNHFYQLASHKNIAMDIVFNPDLIEKPLFVRSHVASLAKILREILDNAIRFTPAGGNIKIQCSWDRFTLRTQITDTGCGIAESDQHLVFEKFKQTEHYLKRTIQGAGLGLPLAKILVTKCGGSIGFKSEVGKGSTFYFTLPLADKYRILQIEPGLKHASKLFPHEVFHLLTVPEDQALHHIESADLDLILLTKHEKDVMDRLKHSPPCHDIPVFYVGDFKDADMRKQNAVRLSLDDFKSQDSVQSLLPHYLDGYK